MVQVIGEHTQYFALDDLKKKKEKKKSIFQLLTRLREDNNPINYHVKHDIKRNLLNFIWIIHM